MSSQSNFITGLLLPGLLLFQAVKAYVLVLRDELIANKSIPRDLRGKAFGRFWQTISGSAPDPSVPLEGSATLVPPLLAKANGVVPEVGPGTGNQTVYYEPVAANIKALYGAEPARDLHKLLRKNVDATTLGQKYKILDADATKSAISKELIGHGTVKNAAEAHDIFDTIICVRVLCSVPDLDQSISDLHDLLRPGGQLIVVEHTANPWRTPKGSVIARLVQSMYMLLGWSYLVGDCSLTRDIETKLRFDSQNRWSTIDIDRHFGHAVLTYISGVLVKKDSRK